MMRLEEIEAFVPRAGFKVLRDEGIDVLRPCQEKAVRAGLMDRKSVLVCTPTASGKTLTAELAFLRTILESHAKAIYIVPLKALANDKHNDFARKYGQHLKVALSIGNTDSADPYLADYDLIICTAEKLDSLIRHHCPWLSQIGLVIVDEVHLLNDAERGPTLEILITMLRQLLPEVQILALSATIGNPRDLADWLHAELVQDDWRPVELHKGIYMDGSIEYP